MTAKQHFCGFVLGGVLACVSGLFCNHYASQASMLVNAADRGVPLARAQARDERALGDVWITTLVVTGAGSLAFLVGFIRTTRKTTISTYAVMHS